MYKSIQGLHFSLVFLGHQVDRRASRQVQAVEQPHNLTALIAHNSPVFHIQQQWRSATALETRLRCLIHAPAIIQCKALGPLLQQMASTAAVPASLCSDPNVFLGIHPKKD